MEEDAGGRLAGRMRPIIFLDFDGVLNSLRSTLAYRNAREFDDVSVALMGRLAVATEAGVVVSSAWRIGRTLEELRATLARNGGEQLAARLIGMTPRNGPQRGDEIAEWLATHPGWHDGRYVIVDDDADMLDSQLDRFVQTRHRDGFGVPEYLAALRVLLPTHADVTQLAWYAIDRPLSSEARGAHQKLNWD